MLSCWLSDVNQVDWRSTRLSLDTARRGCDPTAAPRGPGPPETATGGADAPPPRGPTLLLGEPSPAAESRQQQLGSSTGAVMAATANAMEAVK
jgi:hypothetical protein